MKALEGGEYIEATEMSPMDGEDNDALGFPLSAYCYIPLQPPSVQSQLSRAAVISVCDHVDLLPCCWNEGSSLSVT
jgi:hypothetical protein